MRPCGRHQTAKKKSTRLEGDDMTRKCDECGGELRQREDQDPGVLMCVKCFKGFPPIDKTEEYPARG